jgi:hypothetical protein
LLEFTDIEFHILLMYLFPSDNVESPQLSFFECDVLEVNCFVHVYVLFLEMSVQSVQIQVGYRQHYHTFHAADES